MLKFKSSKCTGRLDPRFQAALISALKWSYKMDLIHWIPPLLPRATAPFPAARLLIFLWSGLKDFLRNKVATDSHVMSLINNTCVTSFDVGLGDLGANNKWSLELWHLFYPWEVRCGLNVDGGAPWSTVTYRVCYCHSAQQVDVLGCATAVQHSKFSSLAKCWHDVLGGNLVSSSVSRHSDLLMMAECEQQIQDNR